MRISAQLAIQPSGTVWIQYTDDGRAVAQVDSDGAILWAMSDRDCMGTDGYAGLAPALQRQHSADIVVYLPQEDST
jgi:hypothetical protein